MKPTEREIGLTQAQAMVILCGIVAEERANLLTKDQDRGVHGLDGQIAEARAEADRWLKTNDKIVNTYGDGKGNWKPA